MCSHFGRCFLKEKTKDSELLIAGSIVLMVIWLFLYSAFQVSTSVSVILLTVAFFLFCFDRWIDSRPRRTH
jgi:hypothetical protein